MDVRTLPSGSSAAGGTPWPPPPHGAPPCHNLTHCQFRGDTGERPHTAASSQRLTLPDTIFSACPRRMLPKPMIPSRTNFMKLALSKLLHPMPMAARQACFPQETRPPSCKGKPYKRIRETLTDRVSEFRLYKEPKVREEGANRCVQDRVRRTTTGRSARIPCPHCENWDYRRRSRRPAMEHPSSVGRNGRRRCVLYAGQDQRQDSQCVRLPLCAMPSDIHPLRRQCRDWQQSRRPTGLCSAVAGAKAWISSWLGRPCMDLREQISGSLCCACPTDKRRILCHSWTAWRTG